tara:strand:+ start:11532 stop:12938 length:1407 start_codon:yes stop_codon:yes gene_type:complete
MVTRTYIDKNNTIIYSTLINTGRNPIAELYYGGKETQSDYTRHLLYFDISDLQDRYTSGELGDLTNVTHILRMTNSSSFDVDLQAQKVLDGKQRTSSFDLVLFRVNKDWDEGCGYDYQKYTFLTNGGDITFVESSSNWINSTTTTPWDQPGVYSGSPSGITVTTQHFDKGNENIEMDVTDEVNSLITGGTTNYGYGISFERDLETKEVVPAQYVGFFTRHTQTYYEPFVETSYNNPIKDDRKNFYRGKVNRLYFYTNLGGEPVNLDIKPTVIIKDGTGTLFSSYTGTQVVQSTKGVYYIELFVPITESDCVLFTDTWSGITINTFNRPPVELDFEIKDDNEYYNFGDSEGLPIEYAVNLSGIKRDEKIKRGDKRKVFVNARKPYTINESSLIDGLQYRLWITEGNSQINVIDWTDVNRSFLKNYFILDTSWMIPNEYYIDIKLTSNQLVKTYTNTLKFNIVNQVNISH